MTRNVKGESATGRLTLSIGYEGFLMPGRDFRCLLVSPYDEESAEAATFIGPCGEFQILLAQGKSRHLACFRLLATIEEPIGHIEVTFPKHPSFLPRLLDRAGDESETSLRLHLPLPFDREAEYHESTEGFSAVWGACRNVKHDFVISMLLIYRHWLGRQWPYAESLPPATSRRGSDPA